MRKRKREEMNEEEEEEEENNYIHIYDNNYKIIYCFQCNIYNIVFEKENNYCNICYKLDTQNVFIDEAKLYFDSKSHIKQTKIIDTNPSFVKTIYYSSKIVQDNV